MHLQLYKNSVKEHLQYIFCDTQQNAYNSLCKMYTRNVKNAVNTNVENINN